MEPKTQNFFIKVLDILSKDYTQTCNEPSGTKLSIVGDEITVTGGLSYATLKRLMDSGLLIDLCHETGQLCIKDRL